LLIPFVSKTSPRTSHEPWALCKKKTKKEGSLFANQL